MKKLMVMIGAAAAAFGLYADSAFSGYANSFEAADAGVSDTTFTASAEDGWTWDGDAFTLGVYDDDAYEYDASASVGSNLRRTEFKGTTDQTKYLTLETGSSKTLLHTIPSASVFVDQLVQFSGFEDAQTNVTGKIAFWMSEFWNDADTEATTNLFVTLGSEATGDYKQQCYQIKNLDGKDFELGKWYRLTVKSIGEMVSGRLGFIAYVDGKMLELDTTVEGYISPYLDQTVYSTDAKKYAAKNQLFPAIEAGAALASVGYNGIGSIDDLVIDDLGPVFARYVDVSFASMDQATIAKVVDAAGNEFSNVSGTISVKQGELTVTLKAKPGYILKCGDKKVNTSDASAGVITITLSDEDYVEAEARIGSTDYETIEAAYTAVLQLEKTQDTVVVEILKNCDATIGDTDVAFYQNGTITIQKGGIWTVTGGADFDGNIGSEGFAKTVTVSGDLWFNGTLKAGSSLTSETIDIDENEITLEPGSMIKTKTDITSILTAAPEGYELKSSVVEGWTTWYLSSLSGFAIIIAGEPATTNYYASLQDAVDAATGAANETVALLGNADLTDWVIVTNTVTLDLNGYTVAPASKFPKTHVWVPSKSTYQDAQDDAIFCVKHGGSLTVNDSVGTGVIDGSSNAYGMYAAIKLTMAGDEIDTMTDKNRATLVVNGGTIKGYYAGITGSGNLNRGNCYVTINGGTIQGLATDDNCGIFFPCYGKLEINAGTITGAMGIYMKSGSAEVTVGSSAVVQATGSKAEFKPSGSGFNNTGDAFVCDNEGYSGNAPAPMIKGGTFNSANGSAVATYAGAGYVATTNFVSGGSFNTDLADGVIANDCYLVKNGSSWAVQDDTEGIVATIGKHGYATLDAALAAATDGQTVKLLADVETAVKQQWNIAEDITLDFADKTITKSLSNDWVFRIVGGANVTFTGTTGGITFYPIALGNPNNPASMIQIFGTLNVTGGVYNSDFTIFKVDEDDDLGNQGTLNVSDGAFTIASKPSGYEGEQWAVMNWATANISGGTWNGEIGTRCCDGNKVSKYGTTTISGTIGGNPVYKLFLGYTGDTSCASFPKIAGVDQANVVLRKASTIADGVYKLTTDGDYVTAKAIENATLTIASVENCEISVTNAAGEVQTTGAKFDKDLETKLYVTRTAASGYELDGYAATETITMSADVVVTAAVKAVEAGFKITISWSDANVKGATYSIDGGTAVEAVSGNEITVSGTMIQVYPSVTDWYKASITNGTPYYAAADIVLTATKINPSSDVENAKSIDEAAEAAGIEKSTAETFAPSGADDEQKRRCLSKVVTWATDSTKGNKSPSAVASSIKFDSNGNPDTTASAAVQQTTKAFLFNVADSEAAVKAAEDGFKFTSITPDTVPTATTTATPNGTVTVQGKADIGDETWLNPTDEGYSNAKFYRAVLTRETLDK